MLPTDDLPSFMKAATAAYFAAGGWLKDVAQMQLRLSLPVHVLASPLGMGDQGIFVPRAERYAEKKKAAPAAIAVTA